MRSSPSRPGPPEPSRPGPPEEAWLDPDGARTVDRLVVTACRLIAERGEEATSLRAVAEAAGCSPALVVHHFGSRDGLIDACDRAVVELLDATLAPLVDDQITDPVSAVESVAGGLLTGLAGNPVVAYALRSLVSGGRVGGHLFAALLEHSVRIDRDLTARGAVRPTDDHEMRAVLLMALDLGMLLLRPHLADQLDLDDEPLARRWASAELDLLTRGWFVPPAPDPEETP